VDLTAPPVDTLPVTGDGSTDRDALTPDGGLLPEVPPAELGRLSIEAFGTPLLWKLLLEYNNVDDPAHFNGPLAVPPMGEAP
jgi:hypothetical protein